MNKMGDWIVGLMIVSRLAVGVVAVAGNRFRASESWAPQQAADGVCRPRFSCVVAEATGSAPRLLHEVILYMALARDLPWSWTPASEQHSRWVARRLTSEYSDDSTSSCQSDDRSRS